MPAFARCPAMIDNGAMARGRTTIALLMAIATVAGCAKYQYSIIEPPELAQAIPRKSEVSIELEPLRYEFVDLGRQLGVRIVNPESGPVTLLGERSYVVDPGGRSHALRGGGDPIRGAPIPMNRNWGPLYREWGPSRASLPAHDGAPAWEEPGRTIIPTATPKPTARSHGPSATCRCAWSTSCTTSTSSISSNCAGSAWATDGRRDHAQFINSYLPADPICVP